MVVDKLGRGFKIFPQSGILKTPEIFGNIAHAGHYSLMIDSFAKF